MQKEINSECKNFDIHKFSFENTRPSNGCNFTLLKIKIMHTFSNAVKIMIFISDIQQFVPIKLCKTAGGIHFFKIIGTLKPENIKLNKNYIWDTLEIDLKEVKVIPMITKLICQELLQSNSKTKPKLTLDEERIFTLPPNAQTRNYMVHFGCRHTRDCVK